MQAQRVETILNAYFNKPYKEYAAIVSGIKANGGLTVEEITAITSKVLFIHALTIVRQAGLPGSQNAFTTTAH